MSMSTPEFSIESLKMLLVVAFLTLATNFIATGMGFVTTLPSTVLIVVLGLVVLLMGRLIPLDLPAFTYAMALTFVLALPFSPVQASFLAAVGEIDFLVMTTLILVYADLSIGLQTGRMKEASQKLVLMAVFVFFGMFFGSALISQAILSAQGII